MFSSKSLKHPLPALTVRKQAQRLLWQVLHCIKEDMRQLRHHSGTDRKQAQRLLWQVLHCDEEDVRQLRHIINSGTRRCAGDRCFRHTLHVPTVQLLDDTDDSLAIIIEHAAYWLHQNGPEDPMCPIVPIIPKYVLYI